MNIDFDKFLKWAQARFGEDNVSNKGGKEVRINSIFDPGDDNFHLWCSPNGGKKKRKFGVYHCFKTDKKGNLVKLVQLVDSCDRDDAISTLNGQASIRDIEKRLEEILCEGTDLVKEVEPKPQVQIFLPANSKLISDLPYNNWWRKRVEEYLIGRKIPIDGLYICTEGNLKGRIVIPYYDKDGNLIYWNARHLGKSKCKYLGPPKEIGVGKEDVVFMANGKWPPAGSTIYLCEGEFNAISLSLCELNAAACGGKNMSEKQALMLSCYKIVLCLDRDKAGKQGTVKMTSVISSVETAKKTKEEKLQFVVPPVGYNDWNEMLMKTNSIMVYHYILKNQQNLDYSWPHGMHSAYVNTKLN